MARIYGWCVKCRRFKAVTVRTWGPGTPAGVCLTCEEKERGK